MAQIATFNDAATGEMVGQLFATRKTFTSGSQGFYGQGKLYIGGKVYQSSVQLVEIGTKPGTKAYEERHANGANPDHSTGNGAVTTVAR